MAPRYLDQPPAQPHECNKGEQLDKMDRTQDRIGETLAEIRDLLAKGQVEFATQNLRIRALECLVYGASGIGAAYMITRIVTGAGGVS